MTRIQRTRKLKDSLVSMVAALDRVETEDAVASQCIKDAMRDVMLVLQSLRSVKRGGVK